MPGIIIYKTSFQHYCLDFPDQSTYRSAKKDIRTNGDQILWKKGNVTIEQVKESRKITSELIKKLNSNENVDFTNILKDFFKCD